MSIIYAIVCHETKMKVDIGQKHVVSSGWYFWSGEDEVMTRLGNFLVDHTGSKLEVVCIDYRSDASKEDNIKAEMCMQYEDYDDFDAHACGLE